MIDERYLEDVVYVRWKQTRWLLLNWICWWKPAVVVRRPEGVKLHLTDAGLWLVEDSAVGEVFYRASQVPYRLVFVSAEDYQRLMAACKKRATRPVHNFVASHCGALPGFRLKGRRLIAPETYATARHATKRKPPFVFAH